MARTKKELRAMTETKANSQKTVDGLVMDELLEMGFSYNFIGTHYLHDSIAYAMLMKLEDFDNVNTFCQRIAKPVQSKYGIAGYQYATAIEDAIEKAFTDGNIRYLLDTFKGSYNHDKEKVTKNVFIMTIRKKIMNDMETQNSHNATQLRLIAQGTIEKITDISILKAICDIVLTLQKGGAV